MHKKIIAKKSLGQHFLKNQYYLKRIVSASISKMSDVEHIVEIGPGTGLLTEKLAQLDKKVLCIEKDTNLFHRLQEEYKDQSQVSFVNDDALGINWNNLNLEKAVLIANLPYNISVPLIIQYLENTHFFLEYCVLIQKEVAQRLAAKPNTKHYGRLAVLAQIYCNVKIHFDIPGNVFSPPTKVTSSFITLSPKNNVSTDFNTLSQILQIVFNHKRKMLRSTIGKTHPDIYKALLEENIKETARPEDISIQQFISCAEKMYTLNKTNAKQ